MMASGLDFDKREQEYFTYATQYPLLQDKCSSACVLSSQRIKQLPAKDIGSF